MLGQETTATNLTSTLMFLARNPEWKKLAREEAEEVLGSKDNVDYSDLNRLSVATNCLKESLRLAPPASILGLQSTEEFLIPPDKMMEERGVDETTIDDSNDFRFERQVGKVIPTGCRILLSVYTMHQNPWFWSNAKDFKPDRWAANTKETSVPMSFIPFSLGSRNCIGQVLSAD